MSANIAILGSGGFGLSLAVMLEKNGHSVTVWSKFRSELDDIRRDGENKAKLPGVRINSNIKLTDDLEACIKDKDIVIFGIPVNFVRGVAKEAAPYISEKSVLVNTGKGLEADTYKRMSVVIKEETGKNCVVLSGPSHAEEVALGMPTTVVTACDTVKYAEYVQRIMSNDTMRIYINNDVIGCEIGGALKNIIALCAGVCDGMGYGDNTKAALMTRGIAEIARLGEALGGKIETFAGLTGVGDLIVTCTSMHSRNRRAGILIGQGVDPAEAVKQVGTVEGYFCTKAAYELAKEHGISVPITEKCYNVLFNGSAPKTAISDLMRRPKKNESESVLLDLKIEQ